MGSKWVIFFSIWLALLSGCFTASLGTPGIFQAFQLKKFLAVRKKQLQELKLETQKIKSEVHNLESNRYVQEREIRKVLGYIGKDEFVFDFSSEL